MAKNWIPLRQVEGTASRQAHVRLPEGTYEREISKEGFFGPSAQFHHKHKPTDWVEFDGAILFEAKDDAAAKASERDRVVRREKDAAVAEASAEADKKAAHERAVRRAEDAKKAEEAKKAAGDANK